MCLLELERAFQAGVLSPTGGPEDLVGMPDGPADGFSIYVRGYRRRLAEALRANYPLLHRVLGDEGFEELAHAFVAASPSTDRSIRWFGAALEKYLDDHPAALPHPALRDLVRMEWAISLAFDAADETPVTEQDVARTVPHRWHRLRFALHPSVRLLDLDWKIEPLWQAMKAEEAAQMQEPERGSHGLVVWRQDLEARWRSVDSQELHLLGLLDAGNSFGDLCAHLAGHAEVNSAAELAAGLLRRWIGHELLVERDTQ